MEISKAHALNEKELQKFNIICHSQRMSVAEYYRETLEQPLLAFEHYHDEYEFIIPTSTISLMKYDKASYIGEVGYCYAVNPGVTHGIEFDLDTSGVISIVANREWVDYLKKKLGYEGQYFYTHFIVTRELIDKIRYFQYKCGDGKANPLVIDDIAEDLMTQIITNGLQSGVDTRKPEKVYAKNIKKVIRFMYENFKNPDLSIADLAKMSGYSISYFSRSFRAYMHEAPIVHLNKLRLSEAKRLFKEIDLTLEQIALRAGYRILSTFTEAFKTMNGCKPKKYRNMYY